MLLRKGRMMLRLVRFYSSQSRLTRVAFLTLLFGGIWTMLYKHHVRSKADPVHQTDSRKIPYDTKVISQALQDLYQDTTEFRLVNSHHCFKVQPWMVIFVFSPPGNEKRRNTIRKTWRNKSLYYPEHTVTILFLLGASTDSTEQLFIDDESNYFTDIVQDVSFIDSPQNSSYKSLSLLKWIALHCPDVQLVMKVDDSCLIVPHLLSNWLNQFNTTQSWPSYSVIGQIVSCGSVSRRHGSEWYVSQQEWPTERFCVKSARGDAYMLTGDAILPLLHASQKARFLKFGSLYVTGVLAEQAQLGYQSISHYTQLDYSGKITVLQLMLYSDIYAVCGLDDMETHDRLWRWYTTPRSNYNYLYIVYSLVSFLLVILWCIWSAGRLLRYFGLLY